MQRIFFCNIGWMKNYQGTKNGESIIHGGEFIKTEGRGHEVCNFLPVLGEVFGYVRTPGKQISLDRLGAGKSATFLEDVTVVWLAGPKGGGTFIVGWYKNATVYRNFQYFSQPPHGHEAEKIHGYWIKAPAKSVTLLQEEDRNYPIKRRIKGSLGRSNIWYADKQESQDIARQVLGFIEGYQAKSKPRGGFNRSTDADHNRLIEQTAVKHCWDFFAGQGYQVTSVEKDNVGWDLEARKEDTTLKLEVKGLTGESLRVGLSPNEFRAFLEKDPKYRLAVVASTLNSPNLYLCRFNTDSQQWVVEGENWELMVSPSISAIISAGP